MPPFALISLEKMGIHGHSTVGADDESVGMKQSIEKY